MDDDAVRTGQSTARCSCNCNPYAILFLMWSLVIVAPIVVLSFAGQRWSLVTSGVGLVAGIIFTCKYLNRGLDEPLPGQHQVNGGVGLSQGDIEAIPAFEYREADADAAAGGGSGPSSSSSVEECAVCISVLRDGETERRLPECGHAFHARCINGWLRGHATCPICRAGIKVVAGDGEPSPVAPAV